MEKQIWLKSVTAEMLSEVEVLDWLEGYGDVLSLAQRNYIRRYGFLLLRQEAKINWLRDLLAIIHRDGGHHTGNVGLEQSTKDAKKKIALLREENERIEEAYRRARQIVDDVQMVGGWTRERKIAYIEEVIKGNN